MEQTLRKIAFSVAILAAISLSGCENGLNSKLQPRDGYELLFAPGKITAKTVECTLLDPDLVSAVPGCRDFGAIIDQSVYDSSKGDPLEVSVSRVPVACGWLRAESATVKAFPDCYIWVKLLVGDGVEAAISAPQPAEPESPSEQSASGSAGNTSVSSSQTSGPDGNTSSASSTTDTVSTSATSSTQSDGSGSFSVDNGHTTMTGTFGADGSVSSVSFSENDESGTTQ
jgi:hypothetical protein